MAKAMSKSGRAGIRSLALSQAGPARSMPPVRMLLLLVLVIALNAAGAVPRGASAQTIYDTALTTLQAGHPRAVVTQASLPAIRAYNKPGSSMWPLCLSSIMAANATIAKARPTSSSPRNYADRMATVAGGYLIDSDPAKFKYALADLLQVTGLSAWTSTFLQVEAYLDVDNYLLATAWGYDWLYAGLTSAQRTRAWAAVRDKAFLPAIQSNMLPVVASLNTNIAVNSLAGYVVAAIVFAENDKTLCQKILSLALPGIARQVRNLTPTGAFFEGQFYGSYIGYNLPFALSALKTGINNDYGLSTSPGLMATAYFRIQCIGPALAPFTYADANTDAVNSMQVSYYAAAQITNLALNTYIPSFEYALKVTGLPFRVFWTNPLTFSPNTPPNPLPLDASHAGYEVKSVFMRTAWDTPLAAYVAVKGGRNPRPNESNHAHLDLGTFVFDNDGQRWFLDLGYDSYSLKGYFVPGYKNRYSYYRTRTEGHNTLAVSNTTQTQLLCGNQAFGAFAPLASPVSTSLFSYTIADLTVSYAGALSVKRGIGLLKDVPKPQGRLLIQDEVLFASNVDILSMFHTGAQVSLSSDRKTATLTKGGTQLQGRILSPGDGVFATFSCNPALIGRSYENANSGVTNVVVRLPTLRKSATITVIWTKNINDAPLPAVQPLVSWNTFIIPTAGLGL